MPTATHQAAAAQEIDRCDLLGRYCRLALRQDKHARHQLEREAAVALGEPAAADAVRRQLSQERVSEVFRDGGVAPGLHGRRDRLLPLLVAHGYHVVRCEVTGEAAPALAHSREGVDYAERMGAHTARIFAYFSLGLANVLNGACTRHSKFWARR